MARRTSRGYCHVDDTTKAICSIIENNVAYNKIYNLGNASEKQSLIELAQKVINILAPESGLEVEVLGSFEGSDRHEDREIHNRFCDTSLIQSELGFKPTVSLQEGIQRIAQHGVIHTDWRKQTGRHGSEKVIKNYRFLAVIPEVQGVPGKNIKLLGGKPLIAHTIEVARASVFD